MNVNYMFALISVVVLALLAYFGVEVLGMKLIFGVLVPYVAVIVFLVGFVKKVMNWAKSPVPFRIPTTCGQQQSFDWIKQNKVDNPSTTAGVVIRMFFEIVTFRSLFRNTKMEIKDGGIISYEWEKWLWIAALAFHYSFLAVVIRHMRLFLEPVPACISMLEALDGFFQIGLPIVLASGVVLFAAACYLLARRLVIPQVKYISLAADYFPLFLIIAIAGTGIFMRYFARVDVVGIKEITMGLATFSPVIVDSVSGIFYVHMFLVCTLLVYFPFSKLMHFAGIFMSPTRNLPNNSRMVRHINPWNPEKKFHTYEAYEDEFREKMIEAGIPVEKES